VSELVSYAEEKPAAEVCEGKEEKERAEKEEKEKEEA
jgi:hypothetical protein